MTAAEHKSSFFRQSGWMMIATVGSGVLMSLVHVFSKVIPSAEYAVLGTLIQVLNWITIPAIGLQTTFAQQTSAVITDKQRQQLVGTVRAVMLGTFCIWLAMALAAFIWRDQLISGLRIGNPACLWITLACGLVMLWRPIFQGLLQGRQNFLWLGWAPVFDGIGRLGIAGLIVFLLRGWTAGIMTGALLGMVAALGVAVWQNRDLWVEPSARFESREWLWRVVPLSLGCGVSQFLFSADVIVVQSSIPGAAPYIFGGTLARAIVLFTAPLVAVMFPKLVHSAARNQKNDLMLLTLVGTLVLSAVAAVGLTVTAPLLIKFGSNPAFVTFAPHIPLFAWSMVPLAVGNVLLNNLMAHSRFKCVPALVVVAVGYWIALQYFHSSFQTVIEVLGIFNLIFLAVCAFFTWCVGKKRPDEAVATLAPPQPLE